MLRASLLITALLATFLLSGQVITMLNPGFEDLPRHSHVPQFWTNCGPPGESPPDIQPELTFQVSLPAYEGNTYLGLVTRDNDTWEGVGTTLSQPLEKGKCYAFSISLARSLSYYSVSREKNIPANFIAPTRLRIWGGNDLCERGELLATSSVVDRGLWVVCTFILSPLEESYSNIVLEVFYEENILFPTNGNLLLDDASALVFLPDCGAEAYGIQEDTNIAKEVTTTPAKVLSVLEDNTLNLILPSLDYFSGPELLKGFVSNIFDDIEFNAKSELVEESYQVEGEKELRSGYPAIHALAYALNAYPGEEWELVVFDKDKERQQQRVTSLKGAMDDWLFSYIFDCQVSGYDDVLDYDTDWFYASIANGLYLRML